MAVQRAYGGVSAGVRRAQRRAALVAAALELIARDGTEAITVRAVCAGAGLNQRYFYESFPDRDDLLFAAFDAAWSEIQTNMRTAAAEASARGEDSPTEKARAAVDAFVTMLVEDPHHGWLLLIEAQGEPALRARRQRLIAEIADFIGDQARGWLGLSDVSPDDLRPTGIMVVGAGHELVQHWHAGGVDLDRPKLVAVLADVWISLFSAAR